MEGAKGPATPLYLLLSPTGLEQVLGLDNHKVILPRQGLLSGKVNEYCSLETQKQFLVAWTLWECFRIF